MASLALRIPPARQDLGQPQLHRLADCLGLQQQHHNRRQEVFLVLRCLSQVEDCSGLRQHLSHSKREDCLDRTPLQHNLPLAAYLGQQQPRSRRLEVYLELQSLLNKQLVGCFPGLVNKTSLLVGSLEPNPPSRHKLEDSSGQARKAVACLEDKILNLPASLLPLYCMFLCCPLLPNLTPHSGNLGSTQNQTSQPQQQSNAFGATQNQTGLFGNSLTGGLKLGQSNQQQQTVPGIRIDTQNIRGTSRYNDLHEELQNDILKLDKVIHDQMALKNQIDAMIPAHHSQLEQVPADVDFCNRKLLGAKAAADSDVQVIALARKQVEVDAENFRLSMKAIDNLRLPSQYHTTPGMWNQKYGSNDNRAQQAETEEIVGFFSKTGDELAGTLSTYQKTLTDIEQHLRGVEANSALQINALVAQRNGNTGGEENPFVILTGVLQDFEQSLLGVAGQVGAAREGVQRLQLGHFSSAPPKQKQGSRGGVY